MYGYIIIIIAIITTTPTNTKNFPFSPYFNLLNKLFILCFLSRLLHSYSICISLSLMQTMDLTLLSVTVVQILSNWIANVTVPMKEQI